MPYLTAEERRGWIESGWLRETDTLAEDDFGLYIVGTMIYLKHAPDVVAEIERGLEKPPIALVGRWPRS